MVFLSYLVECHGIDTVHDGDSLPLQYTQVPNILSGKYYPWVNSGGTAVQYVARILVVVFVTRLSFSVKLLLPLEVSSSSTVEQRQYDYRRYLDRSSYEDRDPS